MAANTEQLVVSLAQSETRNRLLATAVAQSSEAMWTTDLNQVITSWNAGAQAVFGYPEAEAVGHVLRLGAEAHAEDERMARIGKREKFSMKRKR
ncbi:MAG: PAS domain S-box protein [Betaproteobacteria bacterium]|nr:PAS domain S-box protein [Betaproteobacteria bacterium]